MYDSLRKTCSEMPVDRRLTKGRQEVDKRLTEGRQNRLIGSLKNRISRRLIHGVFLFISCCDQPCCFGHISTRVN